MPRTSRLVNSGEKTAYHNKSRYGAPARCFNFFHFEAIGKAKRVKVCEHSVSRIYRNKFDVCLTKTKKAL